MKPKTFPYRCRECSVLLPPGKHGYCSEHCRTAKRKARLEANERKRQDARHGDGRHGPRPNPIDHDITYTTEQLEYLKAVEHYRRTKRRPFPTAAEYLAIAISLGYHR